MPNLTAMVEGLEDVGGDAHGGRNEEEGGSQG
jgi:hypothetical protein